MDSLQIWQSHTRRSSYVFVSDFYVAISFRVALQMSDNGNIETILQQPMLLLDLDFSLALPLNTTSGAEDLSDVAPAKLGKNNRVLVCSCKRYSGRVGSAKIF